MHHDAAPAWVRTCALLAAALLAAGCSKPTPIVPPADDLYKSANDSFEQKNWELAIRDLKTLLENYPLDTRAEEAEIKIAEAHYHDKEYAEAIAAYSDFQRMHPTSPRQAEVEYTIGICYMEQMKTIDRDLSAATNAAARFESVMLRFPTSEFAEKARDKLKLCREHLAAREFYIAEYYRKHGSERASRTRLEGLIATYPETESALRAKASLEALGPGDTVAASGTRTTSPPPPSQLTGPGGEAVRPPAGRDEETDRGPGSPSSGIPRRGDERSPADRGTVPPPLP
jgi:outer membrane protein assembly factor BamD